MSQDGGASIVVNKQNDPFSIRKWLKHVDSHLCKEGVSYLILGLYPEASAIECHGDILKASSATDAYNFLLEKRFGGNQSEAFRWLVHSLRNIGHELRGHFLVEDCLSDFIQPPKPLGEDEMSNDYKFFQCLVRIGTILRRNQNQDTSIAKRLIKKFTTKQNLDMNHRNITGLPELFLRLNQEQIVTCDDTHQLQLALEGYNATECLLYLNEYHKSVQLPLIDKVKHLKRDDFPCSSDPTSLAGSSSAVTPQRKLLPGNKRLSDSNLGMIEEEEGEQLRSLVVSHSPGPSPVPETDRENKGHESHDQRSGELTEGQGPLVHLYHEYLKAVKTGDSEVFHYQQQTSSCSLAATKCARITSLWILILILVLSLCGALYGFVWKNLIPSTEVTTNLKATDNSTIVIKELQGFYHREVKVRASPTLSLYSTQNFFDIDLYKFSSNCDSVPVHNHTITLNMTALKNCTKYFYLMPDSILEYGFERPVSKGANVQVYVTLYKGLQSQSYKTYTYYHDSFGRYSRHYTIQEKDYYRLCFSYKSGADMANFKPYAKITAVRINLVNHVPVCTLNETIENDRCLVQISFSVRKTCLVANILDSDGNLLNIDTRITFFQLILPLVTSISPAIVVILMLAIIGCCVSFCFYKRPCRGKETQTAKYKILKESP